jgi:TIR domain
LNTPAENSAPPRVFISYRWSNPDHEEWVLTFATSLRQSGVDVILDKWHLSEGQDTLTFMEGMVSDPSVTKVLMICDRGYVERANNRQGGVGTEAQIISPKIYEKADQNKFAAIVVELDVDGRPFLPHYMATRLYFDMSTEEAEATNFEKVVRWIFGKPFHPLPPIGERPGYLSDSHPTGRRLLLEGQRLRQIRHTRGTRPADTAASVLNGAVAGAADLIIPLRGVDNAEEVVYEAIRATFPMLEEINGAFVDLIRSGEPRTADIVHSFFEGLLALWEYAPLNTSFTRWDNDVLHFFGHECLVSFVGAAMQERDFHVAADILSMPFYKPRAHERTGEPVYYNSIRSYLESLRSRNDQLKLNRLSLHADLLLEHHEHSVISFTSFMEADITLYVRGLIAPKYGWFPVSAVYLGRSFGALPTYVRATSTKFYERLKPLLLDLDVQTLKATIISSSNERGGLRFDYQDVSVAQLLNLDQISTSA